MYQYHSIVETITFRRESGCWEVGKNSDFLPVAVWSDMKELTNALVQDRPSFMNSVALSVGRCSSAYIDVREDASQAKQNIYSFGEFRSSAEK